MSRINNNVQSLIAQRVLGSNNRTLAVSLERLSTGLRINRGGDDPAGLLASESLRTEKTALNSAIANSERAQQVVNIAEGALQEVASLLNELSGLVTSSASSAGLSNDERAANQLQIDSILQTIDRVAEATSFQGIKLLNGNFDYTTTDVSGEVEAFKVNGAKLGFGGTTDVDVVITQSAQVGGFFLSFGGTALDLGGLSERFVLEVQGSKGTRELSFASGTSLAAISDAVNTFTEVTGVEATVSGDGIRLTSTGVGSSEFVSVTVIDDGGIDTSANQGVYSLGSQNTNVAATTGFTLFNAPAASNKITDSGQDVEATINGIAATTRGATASINTDFLNVEISLTTSTTTGGVANSQNLGRVDAFSITGGGADFQLSPQISIAGKVSLGISNVAARTVGRATNDAGDAYFLSDLAGGKALNVVDGDLNTAEKVVKASISDIASLRGRLGAFQKNIIGSTIRSLGVSLENTTAAEAAIRDTDFASETAQLTRAQILVNATTNVLAIANAQPQSVLQLLG